MFDIDIENRFWSKVERDDENADKCWEWTACLNKGGYGEFGVGNKKKMRAHRFSFQLHHNRLIQDNMCVCHKCDNRKCVNPNHLFEGTNQDNITDRDNKGRGNQQKGENHGLSKLNEIQVLEIRAKYKNGGTTQTQLGLEYGVHNVTISEIIRREIWKHI
jgi:hypothetical protein